MQRDLYQLPVRDHPHGLNARVTAKRSRKALATCAIRSFAILSTLLLAGCEVFNPITPGQALLLMDKKDSADARREGLAALVTHWDFTHQPPYTTRYQQMAQHDPDFIVRAMAIRALNYSRDRSATKIFIAGLDDPNTAVRLESAKALANLPDPGAIEALTARLHGEREIMSDGRPMIVSEDKDVRIAAADALGQYRTLDVAHTLVRFLNEPDFGVAWQSRQSLIALTGQDLDYDENAWLQFLVGPKRPFG